MPAKRITVQFTTETAAFDDRPASEAARIFRDLAGKIERGDHEIYGGNLYDSNGNRVGHWVIKNIA